MADRETALRELLAKGPDASLLREMIAFAAGRLMELEVGAATRTAHGERSAERLVQRNGSRERDWEMRVGTVELVDPRCGSTPACARAHASLRSSSPDGRRRRRSRR